MDDLGISEIECRKRIEDDSDGFREDSAGGALAGILAAIGVFGIVLIALAVTL